MGALRKVKFTTPSLQYSYFVQVRCLGAGKLPDKIVTDTMSGIGIAPAWQGRATPS
jgi:hypothetical protein